MTAARRSQQPTKGVTDLDDIREDVRATENQAQLTGPLRVRGASGPTAAARSLPPLPADHAGVFAAAVLAQLDPTARARYETVLRMEPTFHPGQEHAYLIAPACQILEAELDRLLAAPLKPLAGRLVAALAAERKYAKQTAVLEHWAAGKTPTTIGISSLALLALRKGVEKDDAELRGFLQTQFRPRYAELLASKQLGTAVDRIREHYRNPACHGTGTFDAEDYADCVRLILGAGSFAAWDRAGPEVQPTPADMAVLHHHWTEACQVAQPALRPVDRLLSLRPQLAAGALTVALQVQRGPQGLRLRDWSALSPAKATDFYTGDTIRLGVELGQPCYLTLFKIGSTARAAVLLWNQWLGKKLARSTAERFDFPFTLSDPPGREHFLALASRGPLPFDLLPGPGAPSRKLADEEVSGVVDLLEQFAPGDWATSLCELNVAAP